MRKSKQNIPQNDSEMVIAKPWIGNKFGDMPQEVTQEHDMARELSFSIRRNNIYFKRTTEKKFISTGVFQGQHRMLMAISREENMNQAELAEKMNISPAAVTVSLKKLEAEGYITRTTSKDDNRVNFLTLTEKGKIVVKQSIEIFKQMDDQMFKNFTQEEMNTIQIYLDRIFQNLRELNQP